MGFSYTSFSKGKEFNNEFDGLHSDLDCFLILFARERFPWKKAKADKNVVSWKSFFL